MLWSSSFSIVLIRKFNAGNASLISFLKILAPCFKINESGSSPLGSVATLTLKSFSRNNLDENGWLNHKLDISSGILDRECSKLIKSFFKDKRSKY